MARASAFNRNTSRRAAAAEKLGPPPRREPLPPSPLPAAVLVTLATKALRPASDVHAMTCYALGASQESCSCCRVNSSLANRTFLSYLVYLIKVFSIQGRLISYGSVCRLG